MHRLFVALRPPRQIRERLAALQAGIPGARWQDDEQIHLTLRFIGTLDRPAAEDAAAALARIAAAPIEVALSGVGRFEHRGHTEALWAGIAPRDQLSALHKKVDAALVRTGLEPEGRAYLPHITLARFSRSAGAEHDVGRWLADHGGLASPPFTLTDLLLYESHLSGSGARYEIVARWPLAG
jgi:RNA 2',3'-cyclic 3'-phosphodiesterase